mgnify:CR=1 FL=1
MNGSVAAKLTLSELQIAHDRVWRAREGGNVRRYHTWPIIGEQTNASHTHHMLAMLLILHPNPSLALIRAVTFHDSAEGVLGDTPSPALRDNAALGREYHKAQNAYLLKHFDLNVEALSFSDRDWLNGLDKLEALLFAQEQLALGNSRGRGIVENVVAWFEQGVRERTVPVRLAQYVDVVRQSGG